MKKLLFLLMVLPMLASADDGDTFSEETVEGVLLKYTVISESKKTCMVGEEYEWPVPTSRASRVSEVEESQLSGEITIPEVANGYTVVRIEAFAFEQSAITSIVIPNSVKDIGPCAFYNCSELKSVNLPNQLTRIEGDTFSGCVSLTSIDIPEGVTSIDGYAFANCKQLKEISIPSSVEHFGGCVFWNTGFTSLPRLPESLTSIANSMFYQCTQLASIEIPKNITKIGECAFGRCPISKIEIPASVTHIGVAAFANCTNISDLTIPDNVTEIGMNAFWGCTNLKTVKLSNSITSLSEGVFMECSNLESIDIPNGVRSIGKFTFMSCSSLCSINLPETLEEIGEQAFYGCSSLKQLFIPQNFVRIKKDENNTYWSFIYGCNSLTSIIVDEDNPVFDSRDNCNAIIETASNTLIAGCTATKIPEGITTIGSYAFSGLQNLTTIALPNSLKRIEGGSFNGSGLQKIDIPENVTFIGSYSICNCKQLKTVRSYINEPFEISEHAFQGSTSDATLYVPKGTVDKYMTTKGWTIFKEIVEITNQESLYGEWRLVGWNDGGDWFEVNPNYVGHHHLSIEIPKGGYVKAYSMVNEIFIGLLTLNGNEMIFGGEFQGLSTQVGCGILENEFFEDHIRDIKSYQLEGKLLKLYYTENDYFVFTSDFDDYMAYRPFVEEGKVWKTGARYSGNPMKVVDYYYFDGDTIIDGKVCKQMMCQRYVSPDYLYVELPSLSKLGAWYETDKRVYFYDERKQSMRLMYDFSIEDNDTMLINNFPYVIGSKQAGGLKGFKGVYRDIMFCADEGQNIHSTFWLEGVGGIDGLISNAYNPTLYEPAQFLMSCTVGDEVIYLNDEYEDGATPAGARKDRFDFTHTTKIQPKAPRKNRTGDEESSEMRSLYGEYNDLQLGIHLDPLDDTYQVSITDESNNIVYGKAVDAGTIIGLNIDISAYAKGRYTVTIENSQETFTGIFEAQTAGIIDVARLDGKREIINDKPIYNLQGQRISSLQKGLNIVNGRKVYVK